MPRSFRFVPPDPRDDLLTRPRLLRALLGRWHHRVTCCIGGPGLGKTTLLAQAMELLEIFGLTRVAGEPAKSLPYGSQRCLEIVRAEVVRGERATCVALTLEHGEPADQLRGRLQAWAGPRGWSVTIAPLVGAG